MYLIALDLFSEFEKEQNPTFECGSLEEVTKVARFFMDNGYSVLVKKVDE